MQRPSRKEIADRTLSRLRKFTEHLESGQSIGKAYSCKKVVLDIEMEPYTPELVKEVRDLLSVSQPLFAKFLNVSLSSVQKWERGAKLPSGPVTVLMDEIRKHPDYWRKMFMSMAREVKSAR